MFLNVAEYHVTESAESQPPPRQQPLFVAASILYASSFCRDSFFTLFTNMVIRCVGRQLNTSNVLVRNKAF